MHIVEMRGGGNLSRKNGSRTSASTRVVRNTTPPNENSNDSSSTRVTQITTTTMIDSLETEGIDHGTTNTTQPTQATNQTKVRKGRGMTKGIGRPDPLKRPLVDVCDNTLMLAQARSHNQPMLCGFYTQSNKTWAEWKDVEKDGLWKEFLVYYRFSSPEMEVLGRTVWDMFMDQNYPKFLFQWKIAAIKAHGSIAAAKEHRPGWAKNNAWEELCNYWLSDGFKTSSSLRKANREADEKEIGRPLPQYEDFVEMHTKRKKGIGR